MLLACSVLARSALRCILISSFVKYTCIEFLSTVTVTCIVITAWLYFQGLYSARGRLIDGARMQLRYQSRDISNRLR